MNAPITLGAPALLSPRRHLLSFAIAASLTCLASAAWASGGQVVADGVDELTPGGDYSATADSSAGYVFYALNGGSITAEDTVNLNASGASTAAVRAESGGVVTIRAGSLQTSGRGSAGVWAADGGRVELLADPALGGITITTTGDRASAAESSNNAAAKENEIDRALALVSCKADRAAFRALTHQLRDIATRGKPSAGWEPITKHGDYSRALGYMPGVIAEMRLPSPIPIFGHPSTRLILSRASVVAVFDQALAADLVKALSLDGHGTPVASGGMRIVQSAPEAQRDGIEGKALVAERVEADPTPFAAAGCLYFTR